MADIFGFLVNAAGEIVNGPPGWVGSLVGDTYTIVHDNGTVLVPAVAAIGSPNDTTGNLTTAQLVDVGANSFSWKNYRSTQGFTTNYATAIRIVPAPDHYP